MCVPAWAGVAPAVANNSQMLQPQNLDHLLQRVVELLVAYGEDLLVLAPHPRQPQQLEECPPKARMRQRHRVVENASFCRAPELRGTEKKGDMVEAFSENPLWSDDILPSKVEALAWPEVARREDQRN